MKQLKIIVGILLVFGAGLLVGFSVNSNAVTSSITPQGSTEAASIMVDFGNGNVETFIDVPADGGTLFAILETVLKGKNISFAFQDYKGLGKLVTQIGEQKNGTENKYWQYWVNNRHPEVGADQYIVQPKDVVEWKFTASKEE